MPANYTVVDVLGTAKAAAIMSLFLFAPGYVIGWALNLLGFRQRRAMLKLVFSVPIAIACCPIITYLLERIGREAVWLFYGATWAISVVIVATPTWRRFPLHIQVSKYVWLGCAVAIVWAAVGIGSLVDLQLGHRLYFSIPAYDYSVRTAFTAAAARGMPPSNPFFVSHPPVPLRYHYFWPMMCSLATRLADIDPRYAMFGATLWCGLGVIALIALYVKFFLRTPHVERRSLIGACLLLVTGLDILPTIILRLQTPPKVMPDMEWWNLAQITSWVDSMIWVPHNVGALIACLTGFLVLFLEYRRPIIAALIGGLSFASSAGLSIYVTFTFALFMAAWIVVMLLRREWRAVTPALIAGAVSVFCALPYLLTLVGSASGGAFVVFQLRPFSFATDILAKHRMSQHWMKVVATALLLPINYLLELGFFLLVGIDRLRKLHKRVIEWTTEEATAWTAVGTSFFVGSFLRSNAIPNNDLGYRCFLPAQFFLLLWAIPVVERWLFSRRKKSAAERGAPRTALAIAAACLVLGVIGTSYQVVELRMYPVWSERWQLLRRPWLNADGQLGRRNYDLRQAYDTLNSDVKDGAIIQFNPLTPTYVPHLYYTDHPMAAVGADCGTEFGGRMSDCTPRVKQLAAAFSKGAPPNIAEICREYGIAALLVKDTDPVWQDHKSWVWKQKPVVANDHVRAFLCSKSAADLPIRTSSNHN
jgi:hypothetical protein